MLKKHHLNPSLVTRFFSGVIAPDKKSDQHLGLLMCYEQVWFTGTPKDRKSKR